MTETPTAHFAAARDRVRGRRRELVDERDALDQFCQRVEALPTADGDPTTAPVADRASAPRTPADALAAIRTAFERTVLAVPHGRERYDDPASERLAAELGGDVADALRRATRLTPALRSLVLDACATAHDRRTDRIATLDAERTRLDRAEATARDLLDALAAAEDGAIDDGALPRVRRRCETLRADRRAFRDRNAATADLLAKTYADLSVDDPVLATVDAVERLAAARVDA